MKFDQAFYQFVLAAIALILYVVIVVTGHADDAKELTILLNGLIGAGIWGGIQQRVNSAKIENLVSKNDSELARLNSGK